jgi:hypothetical protein
MGEFGPTGLSDKGIKIMLAGFLQALFLETILEYCCPIG